MIQIAFCDDDQTVLDQLSALLEKYRAQRCVQIQCTAFHSPLDLLAEIEKGWIIKADTIAELADKLGFTGEAKDTFLATVDRYNELYDKQNDEDFGKPAYRLSAIRTAPFYGCWLGASLLTTEQGIAINDKGQALDNDNKPMPGLYVTGDMSGSFFANNYPCLMAGVAMGRTLTYAIKAIKQMGGLE